MRVLVTGASGFVGTYLLRELEGAGHRLFAATSDGNPAVGGAPSGVIHVPLDVTKTESVRGAVRRSRPDLVFHLAAQSSVAGSFTDLAGTWDVNATGTYRLLHALREECTDVRPRVVLVSSAEVHGRVAESRQPITEAEPYAPVSPYAASKAAAEMAVYQASADGLLEAVVTRSFNHTGPGQDVRFALPGFARQLASIARGGAEPVLRVGDLSARRDFLDVRDVVRAYRLLGERGASGETYNVCSGTAISLRSLVERLIEIAGVEVRIEQDAGRTRPVGIPLLRGNSRKLRNLGWKARVSMDETLNDLYRDACTHEC